MVLEKVNSEKATSTSSTAWTVSAVDILAFGTSIGAGLEGFPGAADAFTAGVVASIQYLEDVANDAVAALNATSFA